MPLIVLFGYSTLCIFLRAREFYQQNDNAAGGCCGDKSGISRLTWQSIQSIQQTLPPIGISTGKGLDSRRCRRPSHTQRRRLVPRHSSSNLRPLLYEFDLPCCLSRVTNPPTRPPTILFDDFITTTLATTTSPLLQFTIHKHGYSIHSFDVLRAHSPCGTA